MPSEVWLLGGYQTDFARNFSREGLDFADLTGEVVQRTLESAKVGPAEIGVVHVGNAFGELFTGQGHLGAMPATVCDELWGVPAARHEAACASGSAAALAAIADLRSGAYSSALVVGIELEKTVPGDTATRYLGAAAWIGHEGDGAKYMWPFMFSDIADEYDRRYELRERAQEPQRPDPRLAGAGSGCGRGESGDRGLVAPIRLQPGDRRRRRPGAGV
jgi:acetyl-CoA C-acetyltransferase